jgi:hypothetical protein
MKIKRAVGIAFLVCLAVLLVLIIESKAFGVDLKATDPTSIPLVMWLLSILAAVVLSSAGAAWFLQSPGTFSYTKSGFQFGLSLAFLGFLGDIVAFIPYKDGLELFVKYFSHLRFWSAFILIIVACTLMGYVKNKIRKPDR